MDIEDDDGIAEGLFRNDPVAIPPTGGGVDLVHGIWKHEELVRGGCSRASMYQSIERWSKKLQQTIGEALRF